MEPNIVLTILGLLVVILVVYYFLDKKISTLYKEDYHDTLRPKVDILEDENDRNHVEIWDKISENRKNIDKLTTKK